MKANMKVTGEREFSAATGVSVQVIFFSVMYAVKPLKKAYFLEMDIFLSCSCMDICCFMQFKNYV